MKRIKTYIILIRGINVGGKNKVSMARLRKCMEELGFTGVTTYIASGNVIVRSDKSAKEIKVLVEKVLPTKFKLDSALIKVLVLTHKQLHDVFTRKPKGFGSEPKKYYSDAIFLIDISLKKALTVFDPREGVDTIWPGTGVIYSQRLGSKRAQSRLSKIVGTSAYKSMTIRSWSTTTKLLKILEALTKPQVA